MLSNIQYFSSRKFFLFLFGLLTFQLYSQPSKTSPNIAFLKGQIFGGKNIKFIPPPPNRFSFQKKSVELGIPDYLSSVKIDSRGYLWLASNKGLVRHDGVRTSVFNNISSDSSDFFSRELSNIFIDSQDIIWVTSKDHQLFNFDRNQEVFRHVKIFDQQGKEIKYLQINELVRDSRGIIWLATSGRGLNTFDEKTGQLTHINLEDYLPEDYQTIFSILENRQGNIVGLGWNLFKLNIESRTHKVKSGTWYAKVIGDPRRTNRAVSARRLIEDEQCKIWTGGFEQELFSIDLQNRTHKFYSEDHLGNVSGFSKLGARINDLYLAEDGWIWVANNTSGLSIVNPEEGVFYAIESDPMNPMGLHSSIVTDIEGDQAGGIWVTTWGGGLYHYSNKDNTFQHYYAISNNKNSLSNNEILSFVEQNDSIIWIGTRNGLNKFNRKETSFQQFFPPEDWFFGNKNHLFSLCITEQLGFKPTLWIGSQSGLLNFDLEKEQFNKWKPKSPSSNSVATDYVESITQIQNGSVWVITKLPYRVFKYDSVVNDFKRIPINYQNSTIDPEKVIVNQDSLIWFWSNASQVYELNTATETIIPLLIEDDQSRNFYLPEINTFCKDSLEQYWVGTIAGLFLLQPSDNKANVFTMEYFAEVDGLADNSINSIIQGEKSELWIGSLKGLSKMDLDNKKITNFKKEDGLQSNLFFENVVLKSSSNKDIFFGGSNGFNIINPEKINLDSITTNVEITHIKILRRGKIQTIFSKIEKGIKATPQIEIYHDDKFLKIEYAVLQNLRPHLNQYAYRLKGLDSDWIDVGNELEVTFTNLRPGDYLFEVKAANRLEQWSDKITKLSITIYPPWWKTNLAFLIYFLLFGSISYVVLSFLIKRRRDKQEVIRLQEIDQLKNDFYTNISHEFRTPLTVILGMTERSNHYFRQKNSQKHFQATELIKRNGQGLLQLVNQMMDLSKIESGAFELDYVQGDLSKYLKYVLESFESLAVTKNIRLHFLKEDETYLMDFDKEKILSIFYNLLSNAIKFTDTGGNVYLHLNHKKIDKKVGVEIKVIDTGIGIPAESLPHLFDRFFQAKKQHKTNDQLGSVRTTGSGIGLAIVRELVHKMEGVVSVKSQIGKGTQFIINLPITNNAHKDIGETLTPEKSLRVSDIVNTASSFEREQSLQKIEKDIDNKLPLLLIVEDNKDVAYYIASCVEHQFNYVFAEDGEAGLNLAIEIIPDVIISDVMMPKKDGYELCNALKNDIRTSHIPIVLLTAKIDANSRIKGFKRGADAYLGKPFQVAEMLAVLGNLVKQRKSLQERFRQVKKDGTTNDLNLIQEDSFLLKIRALVIENLDNAEFGVVELGKLLNLSKSQLSRKVKSLTGRSTILNIRRIRLEEAKKLLEQSDLNVSEIAYKTGFTDPAYFSRAFSKEFGFAPSKIRKNRQ